MISAHYQPLYNCFLNAVQYTDTFVSVSTFIAMLMTPIPLVRLTSLRCTNKNNGDKFYRIKFTRAVDEKLIISSFRFLYLR